MPTLPGLWLPAHYLPPKPQPGSGAAEFLGVTLTYSDVYSTKPSWTDVAQALAPYSIERIIDVVCRVSLGLAAADLPWDKSVQIALCRGIFSGDTLRAIGSALDGLRARYEASGRSVPMLVVNEQQLLDLVKAAFLIKDLDEEDSGDPPDGIGRALLMLSDLTVGQPGRLTQLKRGTPEYRDGWLAHTLANSMFLSCSFDYLSAARSYELYLADHEHLKNHPMYVCLPERLLRTHNLSPEAMWSILFAIASKWSRIPLADLRTASVWIDRTTYFSSNFTFSPEDSEQFLAMCCRDAHELQSAIRTHYSTDDIKPFHVIPFAETPLVAFGGRVCPLSIRLLGDKLARGLHYTYLNSDVFTPDERQHYLEFAGVVFEDYVHRLMERIFPQPTNRYIRTENLRPRLPGKNCDGLVVYGRSLALIEVKASLFPAEARAGVDTTALRSRLRDIMSDAGVQLGETIAALRQGFRDERGLIPEDIDQYYPVVVTLEDIAMTPLLRAEVFPDGGVHKALLERDVLPIQCLTVQDIEILEVALEESGRTLESLLREKTGSLEEREDSWRNFLYRRQHLVGDKKNEYLHRRLTTLADRAISFFRDSARDS